MIIASVIGWQLDAQPTENILSAAYHRLAGGNVLGLFVLGNAFGYLIYEDIQMVLARIYAREKFAQAIKEARESGREEERQAFVAWYKRQQAAQQEGRPFDEPPPGFSNAVDGDSTA